MITLICATHRPKNQTQQVVKKYADILRQEGQSVSIFEMDELPEDFLVQNTIGQDPEGLDHIIGAKIIPAKKLVVVAPEYNGSYPGLFKAFIDAVPPKIWRGKKVALVGVASGRAGNLRGMDHLTDVFHHLRAEVFSLKVPISKLDSLMSNGELDDSDTLKILREQAREFVDY